MLRAEPDVVLQAWSADGRVLAFASEDRLMFWELPNCRVLAVSAPEVVDGRRVGFSSSKLDPLGAFAYVTRVKRRAKDGESDWEEIDPTLIDTHTAREVKEFSEQFRGKDKRV